MTADSAAVSSAFVKKPMRTAMVRSAAPAVKTTRPFDLVIFDLGGTLCKLNQPLPNAVETVRKLRGLGVKLRLLTNNARFDRQHVNTQLVRMGFGTSIDEVYGAGLAAAEYASSQGWKRVYAIGEPGLSNALRDRGIEPTREGAEAVVVGVCEAFNYVMIDQAHQLITMGKPFLAINRDRTFAAESGIQHPGAGAMVAAIEAVSGVSPIILGKPEPLMIQQIMEETGVPPDRTLVVGDSMESDIVCGQRAGAHTWLVLSGDTQNPVEGQPYSRDVSGLPF